jgi:hypothetical protein
MKVYEKFLEEEFLVEFFSKVFRSRGRNFGKSRED